MKVLLMIVIPCKNFQKSLIILWMNKKTAKGELIINLLGFVSA